MVIGTDARCQPCPLGTYSEKFDTKRCKHCTTCTNKVVKQNCTGSQNAICGACLDGYEYDPFTYDCFLKEKPVVPTTSYYVPTTEQTTKTTARNTIEKIKTTKSPWTTEETNVTVLPSTQTTVISQTKQGNYTTK